MKIRVLLMGWFLPEEMRALGLAPANERARIEIAAEIRREAAR